ncbi:MAG: hypothetical protein JEZ12_26810 [Desulfobacterium sp.]|nr:hypothetical protein [Desulfobacterium sp.]
MEKKTLITTIAVAAVCITGAAILFSPSSSKDETPPVKTTAETKIIVPAEPSAPPSNMESAPQASSELPVTAKPATKANQPDHPLADAVELMKADGEAYDAETEYQLNQIFEAEVMETFPVYTVQTHNPIEEKKNPKFFGPPQGEVWIRIKPENSREMREIMAQVADLYHENAEHPDDEITVLHWVGGRPWSKETYGPDDFVN